MMLAAALLALAADAAPAPLAPSGKWTVDYRTDMCLASRSFGPADNSVILAIEPAIVMSDDPSGTLFILATNQDGKEVMRGSAEVTGANGGDRMKGLFVSWSVSPTVRGWEVASDTGAPIAIDQASGLTITAGKQVFALQTGAIKPVLTALKTCNDNLMQSWGVDPAAKAEPAGGMNPGGWFSDDDYPAAARRAGAQGRVTIIDTVSADGRVSACRVAVSSKNPDLDMATCELTRRRGRFVSAPGKDNRFAVLSVRWVLDN